MDREKIICIFCGKQADIENQEDLTIVTCSHCKRETDLNKYENIFDQWLSDIRKEV